MTAILDLNIDLVLTGVAVAGMVVLGFTVFVHNTESATARSFFVFTLIGALWSALNFAFYRITDPGTAFIVIRAVIFVAVWFVLSLFQFLFAFPSKKLTYPRWYVFLLAPAAALVSLLTLTPLVFERVLAVGNQGTIQSIQNGWGIYLFAGTALALVVGGLSIFVRKMVKSQTEDRAAYSPVLLGLLLTFALIITFNLVLPAFLDNAQFIVYSSLFILPTMVGATYAIRVHHLFDVKVFSTALLVFLLAIISFAEIIFSNSLESLLFRVGTFVLILTSGIGLIRSVLREVKQREKIQLLAAELQHSNEQLSEFMSLATHEIRNPATFIKGYTAGALEGDVGKLSPLIRDGMEKLYVRANDIIHLGNQYLNKSKFELNQISYSFAPLDLKKLVQDLVHEFEPAAKQQGLVLTGTVSDEDCTVEADAGKLKEVIANLIDNSIKYTPKGSVTVSVKRIDTGVAIAIKDTGVGVPAEVIPKLFKKFSRADAQKANILGTGLGLYISKVFVDAHHGSIKVESIGTNQGSAFTVELPFAQPPQSTAPKSDA